jgi:hypothetical protein
MHNSCMNRAAYIESRGCIGSLSIDLSPETPLEFCSLRHRYTGANILTGPSTGTASGFL